MAFLIATGKSRKSRKHIIVHHTPIILICLLVTMAVGQNRNEDALRNLRDEAIKGVHLFESDRVSIVRAVFLTNKTSNLIEWARYMPSDTPQAVAYIRALLLRQRLELLFDSVGVDSKSAWRIFWKPVLGKLRIEWPDSDMSLKPLAEALICALVCRKLDEVLRTPLLYKPYLSYWCRFDPPKHVLDKGSVVVQRPSLKGRPCPIFIMTTWPNEARSPPFMRYCVWHVVRLQVIVIDDDESDDEQASGSASSDSMVF